jgi:hypothetical protein
MKGMLINVKNEPGRLSSLYLCFSREETKKRSNRLPHAQQHFVVVGASGSLGAKFLPQGI